MPPPTDLLTLVQVGAEPSQVTMRQVVLLDATGRAIRLGTNAYSLNAALPVVVIPDPNGPVTPYQSEQQETLANILLALQAIQDTLARAFP